MKKAMIEQLVLGMVGTNTWLIKNKESNELLIIDPADESARIEEKGLGVNLDYVYANIDDKYEMLTEEERQQIRQR